jgi:tRNA modification GTPase
VQEADVSLCVLSLPEVIFDGPDNPQMGIPPSLERLVTPETFFLLNKADLVTPAIVERVTVLNGGTWAVSLSTSQGTKEFLDGFCRALQER